MAALNQSTALLFLVLIFSIKLSHCVGGNNNTIFCPQIEKQSLLNFKKSLTDPNSLLRSWDSEVNCCKWKGVVCNKFTGHVYELHLGGGGLEGNISSSLLNLTRLRYLDLSQNSFVQTFPSFFGSLTNLEYLNLSSAGFHGKIPHTLGNLSNLRTLELEFSELLYSLAADRLEWLSGLSKLEYLSMYGVDLSNATDWPQAINALPSLLELHLQNCELQFVASMNYVNATSLQLLDLSFNNISSSPVPTWIFQFSNLLYLDIRSSNLVGPIPSISNITKLQYIDLQDNELSSSIPGWLFLCTDLESVDLSKNWLAGEIPREIGNLEALEVLSLQFNNFSGELPLEFAELKSLQILNLGGNSFSGVIPTGLGKLASLEFLNLYGNKFSGNLPESFGQLSNLIYVSIVDNLLEGVVSEGHFANLTNILIFYGSRNRLSLKIGVNWIPPFQLRSLQLRDWNLSTSFDRGLSWLQTQEYLDSLDVSNTGISGQIPIWIFNVVTGFLNISHNKIQGKIPRIPAGEYVCLSSNQLSGSLPQITHEMRALDLSDNSFSGGLSHFLCNGTYYLEVLHLRGNQLGGKLPDCWTQWPWLKYLNLGNNMMFGSIPTTFGYLVYLESLNLYGNKLSGQIPFSMQNCTKLWKMDLSHNDLDGNIPAWLGTSLSNLKFLMLGANKLSGEISPKICHLNSLQILDLSHNNLSGTIPSCANNFTTMSSKQSLDSLSTGVGFYSSTEDASITTKGRELQYDTILSLVTSIDLSTNNLSGEIPKELTSLVGLRTLNLSQNHFTGSIPDRIGDMKQLESLDVSRNSLSGPIPNSITLISSLSYLDLSYNNLTGKIPDGTQIRGFNASFFIGNNLCGPPMTSSCGGDGDEFPRRHGHEDGDERAEIEWFYVILSSGFAIGVSIACSAMALKKSWREAYYGWLECMWDKLYVFVCVRWRRLKFLKGDQNLN